MNLADVIKKCSLDALDASVPCDLLFGKVLKGEVPAIMIGDSVVPDDILYIPDHLKKRQEEIRHGVYEKNIVINEGLEDGDTVLILRGKGGDKYVCLGKV